MDHLKNYIKFNTTACFIYLIANVIWLFFFTGAYPNGDYALIFGIIGVILLGLYLVFAIIAIVHAHGCYKGEEYKLEGGFFYSALIFQGVNFILFIVNFFFTRIYELDVNPTLYYIMFMPLVILIVYNVLCFIKNKHR